VRILEELLIVINGCVLNVECNKLPLWNRTYWNVTLFYSVSVHCNFYCTYSAEETQYLCFIVHTAQNKLSIYVLLYIQLRRNSVFMFYYTYSSEETQYLCFIVHTAQKKLSIYVLLYIQLRRNSVFMFYFSKKKKRKKKETIKRTNCIQACHLKCNTGIAEIKSEAGPSTCNRLPKFLVKLELRWPLLLGHCCRQLRQSCSSTNIVYSRVEWLSLPEYYFASK
jgi:hypothetical protein